MGSDTAVAAALGGLDSPGGMAEVVRRSYACTALDPTAEGTGSNNDNRSVGNPVAV